MARGRKTGGRQRGTPNKRQPDAVIKAAKSGELPLDYMLRVMRDPTVEYPRRDEMAKSAAPFLHARLAATEITGKGGAPLQVNISTEDAKVL